MPRVDAIREGLPRLAWLPSNRHLAEPIELGPVDHPREVGGRGPNSGASLRHAFTR